MERRKKGLISEYKMGRIQKLKKAMIYKKRRIRKKHIGHKD